MQLAGIHINSKQCKNTFFLIADFFLVALKRCLFSLS